MKRLTYIALFAGVCFALAIGTHALLLRVAEGDSTWKTRAAATCAACHRG